MRILLVKTSSLGDVIHNLPVVSDILAHHPDATIDWCVEESFADIPHLHPGVATVHRVAIRRWRKHPFAADTRRQFRQFREALTRQPYDLILDTQGLIKSALVACLARGPRYGYAGDSAREPLAAWCYDHTFSVARQQHAVIRNRALAGAALGYAVTGPVDYGLQPPPLQAPWLPATAYVVLLSATSRDDKLWPEPHWLSLGHQLHQAGLTCILPGGSPLERERARRLAQGIPDAIAAPALPVAQLAGLLAGARGCIGVDTGLTHLAAALEIPTLAIYTATDPGLTGVLSRGPHLNLGGKAQVPSPEDVAAGFFGLLT